ncbi:hypothetical protein B0T16DRAFT_133695 [Cercophora newfieldiana]|uniref:Uncharacterized protein n=1 Tax=Cercophora newfieldiana TaxID=92897 RepID=A0AA40CSG3_9PEZI|nr:hypothetical protein B0T16DRAFT_133695 [Cercophora newfieldiana]
MLPNGIIAKFAGALSGFGSRGVTESQRSTSASTKMPPSKKDRDSSGKKKKAPSRTVWVWVCCKCGKAGSDMLMYREYCPACTWPRCANCDGGPAFYAAIIRQPQWTIICYYGLNSKRLCFWQSHYPPFPARAFKELRPRLCIFQALVASMTGRLYRCTMEERGNLLSGLVLEHGKERIHPRRK